MAHNGDKGLSIDHQPKTGARCRCRPGQQRDNCPACEGTGWVIDFAAIRARTAKAIEAPRTSWPATTHLDLADTLRRVLGLAEAIRYADKIARAGGPLSTVYFNALTVLRFWERDADR